MPGFNKKVSLTALETMCVQRVLVSTISSLFHVYLMVRQLKKRDICNVANSGIKTRLSFRRNGLRFIVQYVSNAKHFLAIQP